MVEGIYIVNVTTDFYMDEDFLSFFYAFVCTL